MTRYPSEDGVDASRGCPASLLLIPLAFARAVSVWLAMRSIRAAK